MATISKIPDLDSGVSSPEVSPEGQSNIEKVLQMGSVSDSEKNKTNKLSGDKTPESKSKSDNTDKSLSVLSQTQDKPKLGGDISDDDDDDNIDESLAERLLGLTEMFPQSVRSATTKISNKTISLVKGAYHLSRQIVWIGVSTSVILFAPVMFEVERYNVEEMVKQDRNRLVLGPGSAMSGLPSTPGLTPPSR